MDKKLYDLMNWPDIEGIIYSDGCNPKNLLGTHSVKGGILIQSFYPAAVGATVKAADGKTYEMEMADEDRDGKVYLKDYEALVLRSLK